VTDAMKLKVATSKKKTTVRLYSPADKGWFSLTADGHMVAKQVRDHKGWNSICDALPGSHIETLVANNVGLSSIGAY
jgi:hypothetical protein